MSNLNIVPVLTKNNISIKFTKDKPISLTAIWKMEGSPEDKKPNDWKNIGGSKKLIQQVAEDLNTATDGIIKSSRGKYGETKAHWKLALEYAAYLNVETKSWMLGIIGDYIAAPEELAVAAFDRITDKKKIAATKARIDGIAIRKSETNAFQSTGLVTQGWQYGSLTNATYEGLLGADAKTLKIEMGLKAKESLRDNLDDECLIAIQLSEMVAARKAAGASTFNQLRDLTYQQAQKVRIAIN
jgi:KilA-N domain